MLNEITDYSVTVPKKNKKGRLWDFVASILFKNIETNEGAPFGAIQIF